MAKRRNYAADLKKFARRTRSELKYEDVDSEGPEHIRRGVKPTFWTACPAMLHRENLRYLYCQSRLEDHERKPAGLIIYKNKFQFFNFFFFGFKSGIVAMEVQLYPNSNMCGRERRTSYSEKMYYKKQ